MTAEPALPGVDVACPYLGLIDDRATRFTFPSTAHRCHATERPSTIDIAKQGRDCLTAEHVTCNRYRPPKLVASAVPSGRVQTVPHVVVAGRPGRSDAGRRLARIAIVAIALVATVLVGLLLGAGLAAQLTGRGEPTPAPSGAAAAPGASIAPATPSPTRASTPAPSPSRSPSPSASPSPSSSPTASPATNSSPAGPIIHVVERGETLTSIASEYGVTIDALKAANEIEDPNLIFVGQELVIPGT